MTRKAAQFLLQSRGVLVTRKAAQFLLQSRGVLVTRKGAQFLLQSRGAGASPVPSSFDPGPQTLSPGSKQRLRRAAGRPVAERGTVQLVARNGAHQALVRRW